jgi:hypothetical protein
MAEKKEFELGSDVAIVSSYDNKDLSSLESKSLPSKGGHVFETDGLEDLYKPIPTYEGIHRYDPQFQWRSEDEKKVVWKVYQHL